MIIKTPRLLVLSAQSCYVPATLSLTTPSPEPTAGEAAIKDLLRLIRNPRPDLRHSRLKGTLSKTPTFLSGALPRDRRGKVPHKGRDLPDFVRARLDDDTLGEETPRIGPPNFILEIVREREFLEALRCAMSCLITSVHCSYLTLVPGVRTWNLQLDGTRAVGVLVLVTKTTANWMRKTNLPTGSKPM